MKRSKVRTGMFDARDRAMKRRRDRHTKAVKPVSSEDELVGCLEKACEDASIEEAERLDLTQYLRETSRFELTAAERLRLLAIQLETILLGEKPKRTWAALERIYREAERLSPDDPWIPASRGVSASEIATLVDPEEAKWLHAIAHRELLQAFESDREDAQIAYARGNAAYMDSEVGVEEALESFDTALKLEPTHAWALLYRAHCLHDAERWQSAAVAYAAVPLAEFTGATSWRADLLVEQLAWCLLQSGDVRRAREEFERILSRYERQPHLAHWSGLRYLAEAAERAFPNLLPRIAALRDAI